MEVVQKFYNIFKSLYESSHGIITRDFPTFDDAFEDNSTRVRFIERLFDNIDSEELSDECKEIFQNSIDFLHSYIIGDYSKSIEVPQLFFQDAFDGTYLPNTEDLNYLFSLLESNLRMFHQFYEGKNFLLKMPENSFNKGMNRIIEVREYNLAHLLGLTEHEGKENNESKNLLKKYFFTTVKEREKYGKEEAVQLLNWLITDEGKKEIIKMNNMTHQFIKEDEKSNPNSYINGKIKQKSLEQLRIRFKNSTGFDFPIINYSRYIVKCINTLNFLNMNNVNEMILDYNAPLGIKNEKDLFLVNCNEKTLEQLSLEYYDLRTCIEKLILEYSNFPKEPQIIAKLLRKININITDKTIEDFMNLIQSYDFVGKHSIKPSSEQYEEIINQGMNELFHQNIHMIGFGSNFNITSTEGNIECCSLNEKKIMTTHCDTSISISISNLISQYYKLGRAFFIDKISETSGTGYIRVSNLTDEISFRKKFNDKVSQQSLEKLSYIKEQFEEKYEIYKNSLNNGKTR